MNKLLKSLLVLFGCCLLVQCKSSQQSSLPLPAEETAPVLKLPTKDTPLATPPPSLYNDLTETAATSLWSATISAAEYNLDLMPSNEQRDAAIQISVLLESRCPRKLTFRWEGFLEEFDYASETSRNHPVSLLDAYRRAQYALRPGARIRLKLHGQVPAYRQPAQRILALRLTDSEGRSLQIRAPYLRHNITH